MMVQIVNRQQRLKGPLGCSDSHLLETPSITCFTAIARLLIANFAALNRSPAVRGLWG